MAAGLQAGDDLVPHVQGLAGVVLSHVFAQLHDGASALVAQLDGDVAEGVALVLVDVGAADAAALHPHQHLVVVDLGQGQLPDIDLLLAHQNGDLGFLRQFVFHKDTSHKQDTLILEEIPKYEKVTLCCFC